MIPYVLIEGPEPSQDLSYKWVQRNAKVQVIEQGIAIEDFSHQCKLRDLDTEYRLLRKLTETKEHLANQETEKASLKLNRYSDLKPCNIPSLTPDYSQAHKSPSLAKER